MVIYMFTYGDKHDQHETTKVDLPQHGGAHRVLLGAWTRGKGSDNRAVYR